MEKHVLLFRPPLANPHALQLAERTDAPDNPLVRAYQKDYGDRRAIATQYERVREQLEDLCERIPRVRLQEVPVRRREKPDLYDHGLTPHHHIIDASAVLTIPFPTYFQVRHLCRYVLEHDKRLILLAHRDDIEEIGCDVHDLQKKYCARVIGHTEPPRNIFLANILDERAVRQATLKAISA